ncbi:MAG TPA: hypothetical protein VGP64_04405 [Polyangia bacterium]|jgi:hypothetical protein
MSFVRPGACSLLVALALGCGSSGGGGYAGKGGAPGGAGGAQAAGGGGGAAGTSGGGGAPDPFAACVWDLGSGTTKPGPAPTRNNSADLSGAVLGDIAFDPTSMRKLVQVQVDVALTGFVVGPTAYVTRTDATTEVASLTLPVKNGGTDTRCFVEATPFRWLNAVAQPLNDPTTFIFVGGSVGVTTAGTYTDTCLAPGETGYFLDIEVPATTEAIYSAVTSVELGVTSTTAGTIAAGYLLPYQYDVGHCPAPDAVRSIRVDARNSGATDVVVASDGPAFGPAVLLDDGGLPAGWVYVERDVVTPLAPGQSTSFVASIPTGASVQRAAFFLSFDGPDATAALEASPSSPRDVTERVRLSRANRHTRWQAARQAAASR